LNGWLEQASDNSCVSLPALSEVVDLVLLEARDKGALVLLQDQLGNKLADALHVQKLDDVNLVLELVAGVVVTLQSVSAPLDAVAALEATTDAAEQLRGDVLRVVVEVLATLRHCPHHLKLRVLCVAGSLPRVAFGAIMRRGGVDGADERVLKLECLVAAEDEVEDAPYDA